MGYIFPLLLKLTLRIFRDQLANESLTYLDATRVFGTYVSDKLARQPIGCRNQADKTPPAELVKEKLAAEMLGNARHMRQIAHKTMPKCLFEKLRRWLLKTFIFHNRRQIVSMIVSSNFVVSFTHKN